MMFGAKGKKIISEYVDNFKKFTGLLEQQEPKHVIEYSNDSGQTLLLLLNKGLIKSCIKVVDSRERHNMALNTYREHCDSGKMRICFVDELPSQKDLKDNYEAFYSFFQSNGLKTLETFDSLLEQRGYHNLNNFLLCWGNKSFGKEFKDAFLDIVSGYLLDKKVKAFEEQMNLISREEVETLLKNKKHYTLIEIYKERQFKEFNELWIYLEYVHNFWKKYVGQETVRVIKKDLSVFFENHIAENGALPFSDHFFSIYTGSLE